MPISRRASRLGRRSPRTRPMDGEGDDGDREAAERQRAGRVAAPGRPDADEGRAPEEDGDAGSAERRVVARARRELGCGFHRVLKRDERDLFDEGREQFVERLAEPLRRVAGAGSTGFGTTSSNLSASGRWAVQVRLAVDDAAVHEQEARPFCHHGFQCYKVGAFRGSNLLFSPRMQAASRSSFQPVEAGAILAGRRECAPAGGALVGWGFGSDGARRARRRRRRHPDRRLRRLPPLQGLLLVMAGVFSTPRPVPGRRVPALAGAAVIVLALPVFLVGGFPLARLGARRRPVGGR